MTAPRLDDIEECMMTVKLRGHEYQDLYLDADEAYAAIRAMLDVRHGKRRRHRPLTRGEALTAKGLRDSGVSEDEVARRLGCTRLMVQSALRRVEGGRYGT